MRLRENINKYLCLLTVLILSFTIKAERIKGKTIGYAAIGGEAIIEFKDSARVFPYEPKYGDWRLVMWVGYVDTSYLINSSTVSSQSIGLDNIDFSKKATLLKEASIFSAQGFYNPLRDKRLVAIYAYIPESSIRDESRMEPRLEEVLKTRKKKR